MCTIGSNMNTMIAVEKEKGKTLERSFNEKVNLFIKRSVGILLYICLLLASWASILYLKAQSQQVAEKLASYIEGASYLSTSIVPGAVTVINAIVPMIIDKITGEILRGAPKASVLDIDVQPPILPYVTKTAASSFAVSNVVDARRSLRKLGQ